MLQELKRKQLIMRSWLIEARQHAKVWLHLTSCAVARWVLGSGIAHKEGFQLNHDADHCTILTAIVQH